MTQASGVYQSAKIHFSSTPLFVILFCVFLFASQSVQAQGPPGYIYCAPEGGTFTLPAKSHVAYGADNKFKYLFNQTGTITFDNETFGGDPIFGTYKSGYYKLADGQESTQNLIGAFGKLKKHITGAAPLSALTINSIAQTIQQNIFVIGDSTDVVLAAFNLVDCYETIKGAIFMNASTQNGFSNDFGAVDGKELVRAVFQVQQGILDYIYTPENIQKYKGILIGRKYKTADYFPGVCPPPSDPLAVYTAKVNATMPTEYGKRTAFSSTPARRPTGYYLAPGSLGTVKVPTALVNKGFKILVGAHTFERTGNDPVRRFFRVTNTFPITDTVTQIINPFGGGIYIITPYKAAEGIQEIQLSNVVPAPFFSAKSFDKTTLQNWLTVQRSNPAPWADFESDKYMMQVPRSWIYNYADPVTLMQDWDNRLDVVSKMLGYPAVRNNTILYLQIDVDIMFGAYGIGNPQINNTYNPHDIENGNKNHWFLKPGVDFWETEFHEMGHAQLFSNFPGEGEAAVNLLAAAIYNRLYGMNIDQALGESFDNHPQITRDQAALNWMVTPNFRAGKPMDISNTTKDEVRYQQRGYAKYVEMAALFGWEVIDSFYNREQLDYIAQTPSDGLKDVDSRILRFSRAAGVDMRPLIHFWGVQPKDSMLLRQRINAENLKPSKLICDRLTHYKSIIPLNNAQFVAHANAFFGGSVPAGGDPDYGSGWYNIWLPQYNETHGALAQSAMQHIIDIYFPGGCPTEEAIPTVTVNSPIICPGQSATLTASGAATYLWSNGQTGSSITVNPSETTTYTVVGRAAGYYSIATAAQVTVNPIPVVSVE
ncbi:MAG: M60 family metallopeptidase, partial [Bacteroidota bacterium]